MIRQLISQHTEASFMAVGAVSRPATTSLSTAVSQPTPKDIPSISTLRRIPELDGLRGVAILLVLLWHAVFQIQPNSTLLTRILSLGSLSWSGVDLFFVLSGFLIGGILLDEKHSPRYFETFYARRAYRILPLYALLLVAQIVTRVPFLPRWIAQSSPDIVPIWSYLSFTQNIWMAAMAGFGSIVMTATWSLAIEEQFYLTSPFLVRKLRTPALLNVLLGIILAAPLLRTFLYFRFRHGGFADYVLMPCRADDLSLGILVALSMRNERVWPCIVASRRILLTLAIVLIFPLAYLSWWRFGPYSGPMVTVGYSLLGLFYTCCLLLTITSSARTRRLLCNKTLTRLGTIAYCTYLFHLPAIEFCSRLLKRRSFSGSTTDFIAGVLGVTITLIMATLSWEYFERPLLRRGHMYKF
jgi:peptidoglycan/LPS O-acetylase OafA/YrhL